MKFGFIAAEKACYPVTLLCRVLGVSRSGFYAWARRGPSARARADARMARAVVGIHAGSRGTYGSPRVHAALRQDGVRTSRKRVARVMRQLGLAARQRRRFARTTDSRHELPIAANVLERVFETNAPNQVWVGDITYIPTDEGWLYLATLLDLFSRRVVGWAVDSTLATQLPLQALRRALQNRRPASGLVHHTDRGCQYASDEYRRALKPHGIRSSMSRRANCWDNAVAESFFATLRAELVDHQRFPTRGAAEKVIGQYIEGFYNTTRLHSYLGYFSPVEFELRSQMTRSAT